MSFDYGNGGSATRPPSDNPAPGAGDSGLTPVYDDPAEAPSESPPPDTRTCVRYVVWEEWQTAGGGACPQCAVFVGEWFERGSGPTPPLHPHCDCRRVAVKWECYSSSGDRVEEGWY